MINDLKKDAEDRMNKSLDSLEHGFAKVRTGRAHPSILNGVMVPYYGSDVPLNQVANVGVEDSRTLLVQPFERTMVAAIDKAIRESDLGLNPITADAIRVPMAAQQGYENLQDPRLPLGLKAHQSHSKEPSHHSR